MTAAELQITLNRRRTDAAEFAGRGLSFLTFQRSTAVAAIRRLPHPCWASCPVFKLQAADSLWSSGFPDNQAPVYGACSSLSIVGSCPKHAYEQGKDQDFYYSVIAAALNDASPLVRKAAIEHLGYAWIGCSPEYAAVALPDMAASDPDPEVRETAKRRVDGFLTRCSLELLLRNLHHNNRNVKIYTLKALRDRHFARPENTARENLFRELYKLLDTSDPEVAYAAYDTIRSHVGDPRTAAQFEAYDFSTVLAQYHSLNVQEVACSLNEPTARNLLRKEANPELQAVALAYLTRARKTVSAEPSVLLPGLSSASGLVSAAHSG